MMGFDGKSLVNPRQIDIVHKVFTPTQKEIIFAEKVVKETCLMPYTDMWITPNGKLGICCCDNFEVTEVGDLNTMPLKDAWNSPAYQKLRNAVKDGRQNYPFCKHCDFIDAGLRMDIVNDILKKNKK